MSEEVKQETSKDEVVVSQETIDSVNNEIKSGDEKAVSDAVKDVEEKTGKSLAELRAELEAAKAATAKIAEEQERQRIEAELALEKSKLEEANRPRSQAIVNESVNPTVSATPPQVESAPVNIPIEQQWAELDALAARGGFSSSGAVRKD